MDARCSVAAEGKQEMIGDDALYRVAMARPTPEHGSLSHSVFMTILLLGAMVAAVVLVPMFTS